MQSSMYTNKTEALKFLLSLGNFSTPDGKTGNSTREDLQKGYLKYTEKTHFKNTIYIVSWY
jgi:hypothetical protein